MFANAFEYITYYAWKNRAQVSLYSWTQMKLLWLTIEVETRNSNNTILGILLEEKKNDYEAYKIEKSIVEGKDEEDKEDDRVSPQPNIHTCTLMSWDDLIDDKKIITKAIVVVRPKRRVVMMGR